MYLGGCQNYGPFWVLNILRHLVFRGSQKDHNLDNHPFVVQKAHWGSCRDRRFRMGSLRGYSWTLFSTPVLLMRPATTFRESILRFCALHCRVFGCAKGPCCGLLFDAGGQALLAVA